MVTSQMLVLEVYFAWLVDAIKTNVAWMRAHGNGVAKVSIDARS